MISGLSNSPYSARSLGGTPVTSQPDGTTSAGPVMAADSYVKRPSAPVRAGGGTDDVMTTVMGVFSKIGQFFKNLWNKLTGHKSAGGTDDQTTTIAKQYGLLATKENVQTFLTEVKGYSVPGPGGFMTLGPGSTDTAGISQLQQALTALGTAVPVTGKYDAATQNAVKAFKQANGLHQTYKAADGSFAINEYLDAQTFQKMMQKLTGR